ncbi:membrane protein insertase YidC [Pelovirga terrestris]|uniref:Membrane protein insertase YidC n=1 Tax=Pelovirga terrestris TaxID=2771352 RepID=A0A8J6QMU6_9BACT|nr:membrane protein insertase YidC [Pelovirga terrestris]MBD1399878.1 membrane protein insertase YidC [Pelovirga terrestris]
MDNRTIIAIVLIILLWSGYSIFLAPSSPVIPPQDQHEQIVQTDSSVDHQPDQIIISDLGYGENLNYEEKFIEIKNDKFDVVFSTRGATIKSINLFDFKEDNKSNSSNFYLLKNDDFKFYSMKSFFSEGLNIPEDIVFKIQNDLVPVFDSGNSLTVSFVAEYNGFLLYKNYTVFRDSYHIDVEVIIENKNDRHFSGVYNLSLINPWSTDTKSDLYSFVGPLTFDGNKLHEDKPKNVIKNSIIYDNFVWSGFTDKYFLQAINTGDSLNQVLIRYHSDLIQNRFSSNSFILLPGQSESFQVTSYFGPKELESLSASDSLFEEAIHFGFFHFLAKPLFDVLRFFNSFINNYGFSIILLTVCIKLIFWPLTQKSYKSMQGMQKLQPEMKRLKEKYADDKQRLNQEMMSFYRDNKVNPLGGCLPILIQIPVFFSLYKVLLDSIELRHAPFILWITDLSAKDPYYITPIVMGASMFLQQKLTPTNLDPTQEKVMLMMPIIFTFLFLNFPAGLVIYWLVNNLLTILQQLLIRRQAQKA